jgi:hypothetical protein
MKKVFLMLSPA